MPTIEFTLSDEDGDEQSFELPGKFEVCHDCEGHGSVLNRSMREHAYTREEFEATFSDEEREQYMTRGGMYDVQCPTCHGQRVEVVVKEAALTPEQRVLLERYEAKQAQLAQWDYEDAITRRMESGGY